MGGINIIFNVSCWRAHTHVHHNGMGHDVLYLNPYGTLWLLSEVLYSNCNCGYMEQDHVAEPGYSEQGYYVLLILFYYLLLLCSVYCVTFRMRFFQNCLYRVFILVNHDA